MNFVSSTNAAHEYKSYIAPSGNLQHELTTVSGGIAEFKINGTSRLSIDSTGVTIPTLAVSGGLTVAGNTLSATGVISLDGVTAGQALAGKALVLDSNKTIVGITSLSSGTLTGTLSTALQPNITSVGTLGSLTVTNGITSGALTCGIACSTISATGLTHTFGTTGDTQLKILASGTDPWPTLNFIRQNVTGGSSTWGFDSFMDWRILATSLGLWVRSGVNNVGAVTRLSITESGNVGIGSNNTSPTRLLDVYAKRLQPIQSRFLSRLTEVPLRNPKQS